MHFDFTGIDETLEMFDKIDGTRIAKRAVNEAAPKAKKALQSSISSAANRGYATGELASAVTASDAKLNEYGVFSVVNAKGKDKKGVRNMEKLAYLEYGVPGRQAPRPVMEKARAMSEEECIQIMERVVDDEVEKL